jgi:hypothetical protein
MCVLLATDANLLKAEETYRMFFSEHYGDNSTLSRQFQQSS